MARLPVPGSDSGQWGQILNDFLKVEHTDTGELKKTALITGAQQTSQKGAANGYASLDEDGLVPLSQLPSTATAGIGDYAGVYAYAQEFNYNDYDDVVFEGTTATRGTSVTWTVGTPGQVRVSADGVYALSLSVGWGDSSPTTTGQYALEARIFASCGFYTTDQRGSIDGDNTQQSLEFTVFLQANQGVSAYLHHTATDDTFTPSVLFLVTRIA